MSRPTRLLAALVLLGALVLAALTPAGGTAREHRTSKPVLDGSVDHQKNVGWIAALMRHPSTADGDRFVRQFCAGSLVGAEWVLTAGHCVFDEEGAVVPPSSLQIAVGDKSLRDQGGEVADIDQIHVFPDFAASGIDWDAALLHLDHAIGTVQPVRMAKHSDHAFYRNRTRSYIAGWGDRRAADDPGQSFPDVLFSAFVPVRSKSTCRRDWGDRFNNTSQFCAGDDDQRPDTCGGDSGGPIAVRRSVHPTRWRLTGITSYGRCGVPGNIGVYTRVSAARIQDWIRDTTGGAVRTSSTP